MYGTTTQSYGRPAATGVARAYVGYAATCAHAAPHDTIVTGPSVPTASDCPVALTSTSPLTIRPFARPVVET